MWINSSTRNSRAEKSMSMVIDSFDSKSFESTLHRMSDIEIHFRNRVLLVQSHLISFQVVRLLTSENANQPGD